MPLEHARNRIEMVLQSRQVGAQRVGLGLHARRQLLEVLLAAAHLRGQPGVLRDGVVVTGGGRGGDDEVVDGGADVGTQRVEFAGRRARGLPAAVEFEVQLVVGDGGGAVVEVSLEIAEARFAVFERVGEGLHFLEGGVEQGFELRLGEEDGVVAWRCGFAVQSVVRRRHGGDAAGWVEGREGVDGAEGLVLLDHFGEDEEVCDRGEEDEIDQGAEGPFGQVGERESIGSGLGPVVELGRLWCRPFLCRGSSGLLRRGLARCVSLPDRGTHPGGFGDGGFVDRGHDELWAGQGGGGGCHGVCGRTSFAIGA